MTDSERYAVPQWLADYVALWIDRLNLGSWRIKLQIEHCPGGDPCIEALCNQTPDLNEAKIVFRSDVDDTENWRVTVIHELLHVKHSRIDHFFEKAVVPEMLTDEGQRLIRTGYNQHYESFIHDMACQLYAMQAYKTPKKERKRPS